MARVTATSFTILGLLNKRPWSAYEATKYLQMSALRAVWPRTEGRIYQEFKNIVQNELATVEKKVRNGRKRDVYTITRKGREAYKSWLNTPEGDFRVESEPLVKILFAGQSVAEAEVHLEHIRDGLVSEVKLACDVIREFVANDFEGSIDIVGGSSILALEVELLQARVRWLTRIEAEVQRRKKRKTTAATISAAKREYVEGLSALDGLLKTLEK
jgi:DNA-binding PadR family transcriptional regulator